jgi:CheY-like chemotaxis protein
MKSQPSPAPASAKRVVLIIDDEDDARTLLSYRLEQHGFRVHCACDGEEAIWMLNTLSPALIITDFSMPGMNGRDLVRSISSAPNLRHIPVIMVSGASEEEALRDAAGSINVRAFIKKSEAWTVIRDEIDKCIEGQKSA